MEAPHISTLVSEYGFKTIAERIEKELRNINVLYGFKVQENYYPLFVDFIIQIYKFESMNDIIMCLTNGSNGNYGKPFKQLDPGTFQNDWMSKHLEQKSIEREKQYLENKHKWESKDDYLKAVKEGIKRQSQEKEIEDADKQNVFDFNNFKMKYESGKGNESTEGTIPPDPKLRNNEMK
ncbi:MAG: hypothetical protein IIC75_03330 [Bacteroidetes bacterium]|nr:hypothetical protein [Bacteroidota bacterium]